VVFALRSDGSPGSSLRVASGGRQWLPIVSAVTADLPRLGKDDMGRRAFRITSKFALVVVVLVPSVAAVAWVGFDGMRSGKASVDSLYSDHLVNVRDAATLAIALQDANRDSLELLFTRDLSARSRIMTDLVTQVSPQVSSGLVAVGAESAADPLERPRAAAMAAGWARFEQLLASGALRGSGTPTIEEATDTQLTGIFAATTTAAKAIVATDAVEAARAHTHAGAVYRSSLRWGLLTVTITLTALAAVVGWLIRSVLPRTLEYSVFAANVTHGDYTQRLRPSGGARPGRAARSRDAQTSQPREQSRAPSLSTRPAVHRGRPSSHPPRRRGPSTARPARSATRVLPVRQPPPPRS